MDIVQDFDSVACELKTLIERDGPADVYAYMLEFAKNRANPTALPEVDRAAVLCDACVTGNLKSLQALLKQKVDPNSSDYDKRFPLHIAAEEGHLDCVKALVEHGANVNAADRWDATPLSGAQQRGHEAVVAYLENQGAVGGAQRLDECDEQVNALCAAASAGRIEEIKKLSREGVNALEGDYDFRTPLHLAAEEGHAEVVTFLLQLPGCDIDVQDRWGTTPLTGAENAGRSEIAALLRERGAKRTGEVIVRRRSQAGGLLAGTEGASLIKAASVGCLAELQKLLKDHNVNECDYDSRYPLHLAAEEGHLDAVKLLVQRGASVNVRDRWGTTPLKGALRNTHNDVADFLKDSGAETDKYQEPKTYASSLRQVRTYFDTVAASFAFPKSDMLPMVPFVLKLRSEFGMSASDHPLLKRELLSICREGDDEEVKAVLQRNRSFAEAVAEMHLPAFDKLDTFAGKFFMFDDLADLTLAGHSEHEQMGTLGSADESFSLVSDIMLDRLVIKNWEMFAKSVNDVFEDVLHNTPNDGDCADYIPDLKNADPEKFAVAVCTVNGQRLTFGDCDDTFSVQSVGKAFAYTRALQLHGHSFVHNHVGQEPSGRAFNDFSLTRMNTPFNPVTNAGAIVTCSMLESEVRCVEERLKPYKEFVSEMAGGDEVGMEVGDCLDVYRSEQECAFRNYALANFMKAEGSFPGFIDSHENLAKSVEFYLRICSSRVSTPLLANVAATYANYGVSPLTGKLHMTETEVKQTLQILYSCGMYDYSGEWACTIGMPAKSGVSGELFIVIPGMLGLSVWSPRLDAIGNSVRGIRFAERFAQKFKSSILDLLFRAKET